jgi:hypothetical protein
MYFFLSSDARTFSSFFEIFTRICETSTKPFILSAEPVPAGLEDDLANHLGLRLSTTKGSLRPLPAAIAPRIGALRIHP